jgi:ElaB/YqjD/DUF883 family membrane-anchored ribosome-binding protein
MTEHTEGAAGDLAADLAALRQDVAHLTETLGKLVQHQTTDRVHAATSEVEASIRRNPLTVVSVALGIGIVLGMVSRSRG